MKQGYSKDMWTALKGANRFFIPHHTKSGGVLCYTLRKFWHFECLSIRPSVSFPDSNLSSFWPIFFKLCMDIDIGEEWFGVEKG